jgi:acyl-CoA reductase-like NAD-dependent aldehyde dehydrogenase
MSALVDHIHAFFSRFVTIGKTDIEDALKAAEAHFEPLVKNAVAEVLASEKKIVAAAEVDYEKLAALVAAEVANLTRSAPAPATAPAPAPVTVSVTPPAAS